MDAVIAEVTAKGVTDKELADAKVRYRSNFYSQLESSFGKSHLLSALALFRDDPQQINSLLTPFENVTAAQVKSGSGEVSGGHESHGDRSRSGSQAATEVGTIVATTQIERD